MGNEKHGIYGCNEILCDEKAEVSLTIGTGEYWLCAKHASRRITEDLLQRPDFVSLMPMRGVE